MGRQTTCNYDFDLDFVYQYVQFTHVAFGLGAAGLSLSGNRKTTTGVLLIGAIVIAGGVTTYALSDMMIYNRRKKREWFADQQEQFRVALAAAHTALASGTATEQHLDFLQREEEHAISLRAAEEEKKRWSLTQRIKGLLYSGLKMDFGDEWRLGANVPSEKESEGPQENQILKAIEERRSQLRSTATTAFATEKERQRNGGPLDQLGTTGAKNSGSQSEEPKAGGWTSFMIRK